MNKPAIEGGTPVRSTKIHYSHQSIDEKDIQAVVDVLKSDFLTCGPAITEMEKKLCEVTGAKYAVACSNGTAALHIACMAAGIGPGDEVITTPITFAASANCALYCGATPVFADINPETYQIDPAEIEKKITDKTKAVIPVDYTGQVVEIAKIREICDKHGLILIEDAAHSIGTLYDGKPVVGGKFIATTVQAGTRKVKRPDGSWQTIKVGGDGSAGQKAGQDLLKTLQSEYPWGLVLIVCAGMKYAAYVEAVRHKDVLTSAELRAESLAKQLLNGFITEK